MSSFTFQDWGLLLIFGSVSVSSWLLLGKILADVFIRLDQSRKRPQYRKWGAEEEIFWPKSAVWFFAGAVCFGAVSVYFSYLFLLFLSSQFTGEIKVDPQSNVFQRGVSSIVVVIFIGIWMRSMSVVGVIEKVSKLEKLPSLFSEKFTASELLSMYESLRHAPTLFWEEYANLPDEEVNEMTNSKYRERAAPFVESKLYTHNRAILSWQVITVILAAVVALANFFFK